jgi:hypothetical protein
LDVIPRYENERVEKDAPVEVPSPEADWEVIWPFAVSFNGYERYDGELSELEASVHAMWDRGRVLPDDLLELRSTLIFTQRQHHW